jgi:acyl-coenzyme A thioesterase PaaI-like protein
MLSLTSHEALQLTATFAITAEYLRSAATPARVRARIYDTASRVAFLRAHVLLRQEEARPNFGEYARRSWFAKA